MTTMTAPAVWLAPDGTPMSWPDEAVRAFYAAAAQPILDVAPRVSTGWPLYPSESWFTKPEWLAPGQKMTVVTEGPEAGRVAGYVAPWGECLLGGDPGSCFTAPTSPTGYIAAMQGDTHTVEGTVVRTANIGGGINHAPVYPGEFSQRVVDHYANTASQLMRVVYGEDDYGIWAAGALWPEVTERQVATIRASALSGDWRWRPELAAYDMAGSQLVSVPGFPLLRGIAAACSAHPIIVGGMGGVPADMLEEVLMEAQTITRYAAREGVQSAVAHAAHVATGTACSCSSAPLEDPMTAAPPPSAPVESTEAPETEPVAPSAEETMRAEYEERIGDLETAMAEVANQVSELMSWVAEMAALSIDADEGAAMPDGPLMLSAAAAPSGPRHPFTDNGSGKCTECDMPEAMHSEKAEAAAPRRPPPPPVVDKRKDRTFPPRDDGPRKDLPPSDPDEDEERRRPPQPPVLDKRKRPR